MRPLTPLPLLFSDTPTLKMFGSTLSGFIHPASDIDCVLELDAPETTENRKLWQQIILTKVHDAAMVDGFSLRDSAEWKDTIELRSEYGVRVDFHCAYGKDHHPARALRLARLFDKKKHIINTKMNDPEITSTVIRIIVGRAHACRVRDHVNLKNCHMVIIVFAWMLYRYRGNGENYCHAVSNFFTWANAFEWELFSVTLDGIATRASTEDGVVRLAVDRHTSWNLTQKVTAKGLEHLRVLIKGLFCKEGTFLQEKLISILRSELYAQYM